MSIYVFCFGSIVAQVLKENVWCDLLDIILIYWHLKLICKDDDKKNSSENLIYKVQEVLSSNSGKNTSIIHST